MDFLAGGLILWALLTSFYIIEYAPYCKDCSPGGKFIVMMIFMIGAPIFAAANLLEALLDCLLPDDWHDGGDGGFML